MTYNITYRRKSCYTEQLYYINDKNHIASINQGSNKREVIQQTYKNYRSLRNRRNSFNQEARQTVHDN